MRLDLLVFVFWLADVHCGIIADGGSLEERDDGKTGKRRSENGVKYGGGRSEVAGKAAVAKNALSMLSGPSPVVKQKRCCPSSVFYRLGSPYYLDPEPVIGVGAGIQRRDIQSTLTRRLCTTCLGRPQCKLHQKCEQCGKWCTPEEIASLKSPTAQKLTMTVTPVATTTLSTPVVTTVETPVLGSTHQKTDPPIVGIESRFGGRSREPHMKRIHTIATLKSGNLKEAICKLLGVVDVSDIDTVVVWVTTRSNRPPRFDAEYQKSVSPQAEKLTQRLNEELDKALEEKKLQYGRNYLTNDEIIQVMNRVPIDMKENKEGEERSSSSEDERFLPVYPIDPSGLESGIPRILNPGVIEDTPDMTLLGAEEEKAVESRIGEIGPAVTDREEPTIEPLKERDGIIASETPQKIETEAIGVTPTIMTTKESTEQNSIQSSTKETLIVSPNLSDSDEEQTSATKEDQAEELAATQDEMEAQTEESEDDKLRTSSLKQKIKNKAGKLHSGFILHPKKSRTNEESTESVVGAVEEETEENITSEMSTEKLVDKLGTFKLIQKIKEKKAQKMQGGYKPGSQYYRANSEEEDNVVEATESVPNIENVTPTEEKPQQDEPTVLTNGENSISSLTSDDLVKTEDITKSEGIETTEVNDVGDNAPLGENPNADADTVGSPISEEASEKIEETPIPLKARTHALLDKIKQKLEQKKKGPQPVIQYYREADEEIGSPIDGGETGRDAAAKDKSVEVVKATEKVAQGTSPELHTVDNIADPDDQEPRDKITYQDPQSSSVVIDDFQKAKEVLKDVENLVETIRKETNVPQGVEFLGKQQENGGTESQEGTIIEGEEISQPQQTTFAPVAFITDKTEVVSENNEPYGIDKTKEVMEDNEAAIGQAQEEIERTKSDDVVGSQPLEEIIPYGGDIGQPIIKIPDYRSSEQVSVGSPHVMEEENFTTHPSSDTQENILEDQIIDTTGPKDSESNIHTSPIDDKELAEENRIDISSRSKFSGEVANLGPAVWSNSLGKIIPSQQDTALVSMEPKDIFFIGNGIKLPLQMVRKNDGVVHLSVDLDKLCSCKNSTCPKNHTAIEETVGTILEKEAELKDQLAETDPEFSDAPVGMAAPTNGEKLVDNGLEKQEEFVRSVNKRSVEQKGLDEKLIVPNNEDRSVAQVQTNAIGGDHAKNDSNTELEEESNLSPFVFKQLMDRKITELKSKISNMGRRNELLGSHLIFPQNGLRNLLNNIGREFNRGTTSQEDTLIHKLGQPESDNGILSLSTPMVHEKVRGDEMYDETIPIKNVHQFKKLEENLEDDLDKFNEFVSQYTKDHEKDIGEEAKTFMKMHEDLTVKKQIDIMNTFIAWMKRIAMNKEK